ncbi:hypothetical protein NMY22_g3195 [Coprinellus aureogranulatus]|nr:hypothetical protein NMY22_g3195 [Coprinellus aureogranulatus]
MIMTKNAEEYELKMDMLTSYSRTRLTSTLQDSHVYVCQRRVLQLLAQKPRFESFREDFIPWLCKIQYQPHKRRKYAEFISSIPNQTNYLSQYLALAHSTTPSPSANSAALVPPDESSTPTTNTPHAKTPPPSFKVTITVHQGDDGLALRINNLYALLEMNRSFLSPTASPTDTSAQGLVIDPKAQISPDTLVGSSTQVGERTVVKRSVIGRHCVIGRNVKIVGCILLDHCVIEDGAKLEGGSRQSARTGAGTGVHLTSWGRPYSWKYSLRPSFADFNKSTTAFELKPEEDGKKHWSWRWKAAFSIRLRPWKKKQDPETSQAAKIKSVLPRNSFAIDATRSLVPLTIPPLPPARAISHGSPATSNSSLRIQNPGDAQSFNLEVQGNSEKRRHRDPRSLPSSSGRSQSPLSRTTLAHQSSTTFSSITSQSSTNLVGEATPQESVDSPVLPEGGAITPFPPPVSSTPSDGNAILPDAVGVINQHEQEHIANGTPFILSETSRCRDCRVYARTLRYAVMSDKARGKMPEL